VSIEPTNCQSPYATLSGHEVRRWGGALGSLIDALRQLYNVRELIEWGGIVGITGIVFVETGLFFGFFLPGDSLLVIAGIFAASGKLDIKWLLVFPTLAAIVGDQTGYMIGRTAGSALADRYPKFKTQLDRAHAFYEKHGTKTIVIARFVPIIRTFVPAVAGAAKMRYRSFVVFNIVGGTLWVFSTVLLGYGLGTRFPVIANHPDLVILVVIFLSLIPVMLEWYKHRTQT
jgi:membrane-associated protein